MAVAAVVAEGEVAALLDTKLEAAYEYRSLSAAGCWSTDYIDHQLHHYHGHVGLAVDLGYHAIALDDYYSRTNYDQNGWFLTTRTTKMMDANAMAEHHDVKACRRACSGLVCIKCEERNIEYQTHQRLVHRNVVS